jgi:predicted RNA methylase
VIKIVKIINDKYYTSKELARYCIEKTFEVINQSGITEIIEPSAGNGSFSNQIENCMAYDIEPEANNITKQDFLQLNLDYKKGRLIIGNPPFGTRNTMSVKFYKKAVAIGDYISFILPISQLNNNHQMYHFDLLYSEDLGEQIYSDRKLHCCFNIYRRPKSGELNKKPEYKLKDVEIFENRRTGQQISNYNDFDIAICSFGSGIIGKIPEFKGQYAKEFYFKIHNKELKTTIKDLIIHTDWENDVCNGISGQTNLAQWQVYKYILEKIPNIK